MWLLVAFFASVVAMAAIGALAYSSRDVNDTNTYYGHGMMYGSWGLGMVGLMVVPGILLVIIILVAIEGVWDEPTRSYPVYAQPQTPLEILNQRLARGEISQEEYQRVKNELAHQ